MIAKKHKDYEEEVKRLDYTLDGVMNEINYLNKKSYKTINEEVVGNIIAADRKKLKHLERSKNSPYFGRIDFKEDGQDKVEQMYIGKVGLLDPNDEKEINQLIIDWRAPIASLYYDGNLGKAGYDCPEGHLTGDLLVKRNYKVENKELEEISDIDVTAIDEMLIGFLEGSKDNKLRDIVATIQSEQNDIIRADIKKSLIVQGAAGGGKTTIALHRIAYLMYMLRDKVKPEEFMIIAPNKLFLNYISNVLPELGVDDVNQTTFEELVRGILADEATIEDPDEKLIRIVEKDGKGAEIEKSKGISNFKSSMVYQKGLAAYIEKIHAGTIPMKDLVFEGVVLARAEEITRLYNEEYQKYPISKRVDMIQDYITFRADVNKEIIIEAIKNNLNEKENDRLKGAKSDDETRKIKGETYVQQQNNIKDLKKNVKKAVAGYIAPPKKSILKYYKDFISDSRLFSDCMAESNVPVELMEDARIHTKNLISKNKIEVEDFAPIMYLKGKLHGISDFEDMRHVIVDEAQDTGAFQYFVLQDLIKNGTFTILGDIAQGINSHRGTENWEDLKRDAFDDKCEILNLEQSYRTTVEIMDAANTVLGKLNNDSVVYAKPVLRHGEGVDLTECKSKEELYLSIKNRIDELKDVSKSIAVIGKMANECEEIYHYLKELEGIDAQLLTDRESEYSKQVVVVPSYLSKGLEFDSVILSDVNKENYTVNDLNAKLLYVSMTRALHTLDIYANGEASELLDGMQPSNEIKKNEEEDQIL